MRIEKIRQNKEGEKRRSNREPGKDKPCTYSRLGTADDRSALGRARPSAPRVFQTRRQQGDGKCNANERERKGPTFVKEASKNEGMTRKKFSTEGVGNDI